MRALNIGATGMLAQQKNVEVVSNNLANMGTNGFKKRRPEFHDLLYQNYRRVGSVSSDAGTIVPSGVQLGLGVKLAAVYRINIQGSLQATDNVFDLAIQGKGLFQIALPNGETAYTRDGTFQLSADGVIVSHDGYPVQPEITIPEEAIDVTISANGTVQVKLAGQPESVVGQLTLATFLNPSGLDAIGDNYLLETAASGAPTVGEPGLNGIGTMQQGYLETSNVNAVEEVGLLISAQRAYEMCSKAIKTADEMARTSSNLK